MTCPRCAFANPPGMRFCGGCGAQLPGESSTLAPEVRPRAERRHLTVLFCDLVGSTSLSETLDPEALRDLIRIYHDRCRTTVERRGGRVANYIGDGVLAHFGDVKAHEDDAVQAVRAAVEMAGSVRGIGAELPWAADLGLAVRIGVHTGMAIVGDIGTGAGSRQLAVGATHNLAFRIQEVAEPHSVLLSDATFRLVDGFVATEPAGSHRLKGFSDPVTLHRVLGTQKGATRFRASAGEALTPLVSREVELAALDEGWRAARAGSGRAFALVGEAGIGKSRLVEEFKTHVAGAGALVELHCSPHLENTALHPVVELLRGMVDDEPTAADGPAGGEQRIRRLESLVEAAGLPREPAVQVLATLLSLPVGDRYPARRLSPERFRDVAHNTLVSWIQRLSERHPTVLVVEDLHWSDPSTLEVLESLIERASASRLLTVLTYRPQPGPGWRPPARVQKIELERLSPVEVETMIRWLPGQELLSPAALTAIAEKSDGVPLFVQELTRAVRDASDSGSPESEQTVRAVPERLHDLLLARLDRLGSAKQIAQVAAAIGRSFDVDLLQAIVDGAPASLHGELTRLIEAGVLQPGSSSLRESFLFQHALIQDAAYESMLQSDRTRLHERIAVTLTERFPQIAEATPELLAYHFALAGLEDQAVSYWYRAGRQALMAHASVEAQHHLRAGLEALGRLPSTQERTLQELHLLTALGPAVMATEGFGSEQVEPIYRRAEELTQVLDHRTVDLFPTISGISRFYGVRADLDTTRRLRERLLHLAEERGPPAHLMVAHALLGSTLFHLARYEEAREHTLRAVSLFDADPQVPQAFLYSLHPGTSGRGFLAYILAYTGAPDSAVERIREALAFAETLNDPSNLAFCLNAAAMVHQVRREPGEVRRYAQRAEVISAQEGYPLPRTWASMYLGWATAEEQRSAEGAQLLEEGLSTWLAMGTRSLQSMFLAILAETVAGFGRIDDAMGMLDRAEAFVRETGERFHLPELYRIRGDLLRSLGDTGAATQAYQRAVATAAGSGARWLQLRAARCLARLWAECDQTEQAEAILGPLLAEQTEGADTPDVLEATSIFSGVRQG